MTERISTAEIDLVGVLNIIKRQFLWIILAALACGAMAWSFSEFVIAPKYTATVTMYVYSDAERGSGSYTPSEITASELSASQKLVDTYIVILKSNTVLDKIRTNLQLKGSLDTLKSKISAQSVSNTEVFSISIEDTDPAQAQMIANEIAEVAPDEIVRVVKAGGVEIIDYAELPEQPSSPNVKRNTLLGVFIGAVLSFGCFLLVELFDTKIRSEEDLIVNFGLPVLGNIPPLLVAADEKVSKGN